MPDEVEYVPAWHWFHVAESIAPDANVNSISHTGETTIKSGFAPKALEYVPEMHKLHVVSALAPGTYLEEIQIQAINQFDLNQ